MRLKIKNFIKKIILTDDEIKYLKEKNVNNEGRTEINLKEFPSSKEKFDYILNFALNLEKENPLGLVDLIRILLRPLQSELLISSVETEEHKSCKEVNGHNFFMPNCQYYELQSTWGKAKLKKEDFLIHLNKDPVLPCPWYRSRYISSISHIGTNKKINKQEWSSYGGEWKQDKGNHLISLWQPWGLAFVGGGNHSISVGILNGEGTLEPEYVYDMSFLLEIVKCDGENYIAIETNEILDCVNDVRIAAVFEIGRLLKKHNIIPMHI